MIAFEYNGKKYPWRWDSMKVLIHASDRSGVVDSTEVGNHIDRCILGSGTDVERLKWIYHIAHAGFYAADQELHEQLGEKGVDEILTDPASFPIMCAEIWRRAALFAEAHDTKKKSRRSLREIFKKAAKVFAN